jgi:hypothetical protein
MFRSVAISAAVLAGFSISTLPSYANTITTYGFTDTTNGENASGTLVDNGTNDVLTLTNNLADPGSVVGEISGIILTFKSNLGTISLTSQTSGTGDLITITGKKGGKHPAPGTGTTFTGNPDNWTSTALLKTLTLSTNHDDKNAGNICVKGAPCDLIAGPGPYSNADSSFNSHDPSVYEIGVFDLSGMTGLTLVSAQFQFGTTPTRGALLTPTITVTNHGNVATPLPAALPLLGSVLGGGYLVALFRRRRNGSASESLPA